MNSNLTQILTIIIPVIVAFFTGGGLVEYVKYRESRPESQAKAKQINVTSEISVAEAWQRYAQNVEKRFSALEKKYDDAIALKDKEILRLQSDVESLTTELKKYRKIDEKTEIAREVLHTTVDQSIDEIKPHG